MFGIEVLGYPAVQFLICSLAALVMTLLLGAGRKYVASKIEVGSSEENLTQIGWNRLWSVILNKVNLLFLFAASVLFFGYLVELEAAWLNKLKVITGLATLLQLGIIGASALEFGVTKFLTIKAKDESVESLMTGKNVLTLIGSFFIWSLVFLLGLENLGFDISALIAGLGIGGIAIGLALQNVLGDLLASISLLFDRPFVQGDFIICGDYLGTIERVGLKTTRIRSLGGELLIFPNKDLVNSRIRNYTKMSERRVVFGLGVIYQTPMEKLQTIPQLVEEIISKQDSTRFDRCHFKSYGDFSLNFECVYYVLSADYTQYMDIQEKINLEIYERFAAHGIEFAYPSQTLFLNKENVQTTS